MKAQSIKRGEYLWKKTIVFSEKCSWIPGTHLAERMRSNSFVDWARVIITTDEENVVGFCVFEEKGIMMPPEYDFSPFINLVFVYEHYRGKRISELMIRFALDYAKEIGFKEVYLKSEHHGLYEKYGFEKIADFEPIQGPANQLFRIAI